MPAPFSPQIACTSPARTCIDTSSSALTPGNSFVMERISRMTGESTPMRGTPGDVAARELFALRHGTGHVVLDLRPRRRPPVMCTDGHPVIRRRRAGPSVEPGEGAGPAECDRSHCDWSKANPERVCCQMPMPIRYRTRADRRAPRLLTARPAVR
ncbi:hypothetical protein FRIGORI9N_240109 [Frigoribacterium sp. 9N]|nr:hypothetical protein FRIGORI9N_240109 [Frigoribacterium sp. 9N]